MQTRFDRILASSGLRPPLLLAVSGGVDSMVLANLFLHASDPAFRDFSVAHCNFHLRGKDSDADEASVVSWCGRNGVRCFRADFDTAAEAGREGESVEMAARRLRYGWFASLCAGHGFSAVVVAHHQDDNVETMLLNLLRGTGTKGLCGMRRLTLAPDSPAGVPVFRPLLDFSREEILSYARDRGLSWREDLSNTDVNIKRNRIRREFFPLLSQINPSFRQTLTEDMDRIREVQEIADESFRKVEAAVAEAPGEGELLRLSIGELLSSGHLHYYLHRFLSPCGFPAAAVDDLTRLLSGGGPTAGHSFIGDGCRAEVSSTHVTVVPEDSATALPEPLTVSAPGRYRIGGIGFEVDLVPLPEDLHTEEGVLLFDADRLPFPFTVRPWRAGDWMCPLGLMTSSGRQGRKKLSDIFTDGKYSASRKRKALVIEGEGSHVSALLCSRIDASVRVTETSARVGRIRFI